MPETRHGFVRALVFGQSEKWEGAMDILQLLKDDLHGLLGEAEGLANVTTKKKVLETYPAFDQKVRKMVATEQRFLFPEIEELFENEGVLGDAGRRHKDIVKHLDKVRKQVSGKKFELIELKPGLGALLKALERHNADAEQVIIPRMRREISTADREDLAIVYLDAKQETDGASPASARKAKGTLSYARA